MYDIAFSLVLPLYIMELFDSFSPYLTFLFFFLFLLNIAQRSTSNSTRLPPGPWKLPLLGNIHQLVGSLPHHALRNLANKYGPLMHLQLGEVSNVIVSSPEIAKEVMKTHDIIFANRPNILVSKIISYNATNIAFSPCGTYWRQLRKICNAELLNAKRVQSFKFIREEEVSTLIKTAASSEGSVINLTQKIFSMTNAIIARAAFGKKCKYQEEAISMIKEIADLAGGFYVADLFPSIKALQMMSGMKVRLEKAHAEIDRILGSIISDHRSRKDTVLDEAEEDLVDVLLQFQQQNDLEVPLTDDNIKAVILDIFAGGSETSASVLVWAMSEMLKNPKIMEEAQAEVRRVFDGKGYMDETELHQLKYLKAVIKETLRLHPSVPLLLPRESSQSCEINGYEIPAKTKVIINAWAIGRDPKYWSEAEKFKPERFLDSTITYKGTDFEFIPFGAGRRMCPGITFATPNIELPLAQLLYNFDWKLPNGMKNEELDMNEAFGAAVRKKSDLCLIPFGYHTQCLPK